ncbi:hypothetical protein JK364_30030 [Streptomyces sp. 110]|uniref:GAF domain-containing protein n=1 Tax=Streptomyces endocoffeicus TaxID=2898945 RepID=A0ABS1PVX3_9ACTN|nr:hypothetical protein [Streptomyces endocoffeicus]MBL1116598.1 hypothetical protein [Streptomyces endocoffeicus]
MAPPGVAQDLLPHRCLTLFTGFDGIDGEDEAGILRRAMTQVSTVGTGCAEAGYLRLGEGLVRCPYDGQRAGLAAAAEDRFGNLRAWAGPGRPDPYPKPDPERREELLREAARRPRPVRVRDRLVAVADPRGEVLGALSLVDPEGRADERAVRALDHAATSLGLELAHVRELAEVELRLRRELVDDLLSGAGDGSAAADTSAVGGGSTAGDTRAADDGSVAIRVGASCDTPHEVPRSYQEALRALEVRRRSPSPYGMTCYDDLGLCRILPTGNGHREVERFVREPTRRHHTTRRDGQ